MNKYIESLLAEREGYIRRNLSARVKQVEDALKDAGHKVVEAAVAQPKQERAIKQPVAKRDK
jgi:hypothetical protein